MSVSSISQSRTSPRPNPAVLHPPQYRAQHQPHLHHQTQYQQGYGHNQEFPPEFTPDHRGNGMAFNNPPRGPPPKWAEQVQSSSDDSAPEADDNNPWESGTSLLKELTEASAAGNSENLAVSHSARLAYIRGTKPSSNKSSRAKVLGASSKTRTPKHSPSLTSTSVVEVTGNEAGSSDQSAIEDEVIIDTREAAEPIKPLQVAPETEPIVATAHNDRLQPPRHSLAPKGKEAILSHIHRKDHPGLIAPPPSAPKQYKRGDKPAQPSMVNSIGSMTRKWGSKPATPNDTPQVITNSLPSPLTTVMQFQPAVQEPENSTSSNPWDEGDGIDPKRLEQWASQVQPLSPDATSPAAPPTVLEPYEQTNDSTDFDHNPARPPSVKQVLPPMTTYYSPSEVETIEPTIPASAKVDESLSKKKVKAPQVLDVTVNVKGEEKRYEPASGDERLEGFKAVKSRARAEVGRNGRQETPVPYWKRPPSMMYSPTFATRRLLITFPFPIRRDAVESAVRQNFSRYGTVRSALHYQAGGDSTEKAFVIFEEEESVRACLQDPLSTSFEYQSSSFTPKSTFEVVLQYLPAEHMTRTVFIKLEGKRFDEKPRRDSSSPVRRVNVRSEVPSPTTPFRVLEQTTTDPSYPSGSTTAAPPNIPRLPEIVTILAVPAPTYREQRKAAQGRPAYKPRYWARVLDPDATVDMVVQMTKMETGMEARVLDEIWLGKSSAEKDIVPRLCEYFAEVVDFIPPTRAGEGWLVTVGGPQEARRLMDEVGKIPGAVARWANEGDGYRPPGSDCSPSRGESVLSPFARLERRLEGGLIERGPHHLGGRISGQPAQVFNSGAGPVPGLQLHGIASSPAIPSKGHPAPSAANVFMQPTPRSAHFHRRSVHTYKSRLLEEVELEGHVHYVDKAAVHVGRLVKGMETKETLLRRFERYGKICDIEYNPLSTQQTYATARILYQSVDAAQRAIEYEAESVSFGSGIKVEERRVLPMDVQTREMLIDQLGRPVSPSMASQYSTPSDRAESFNPTLAMPPPLGNQYQLGHPGVYAANTSNVVQPYGVTTGFSIPPPIVFGYGAMPSPYYQHTQALSATPLSPSNPHFTVPMGEVVRSHLPSNVAPPAPSAAFDSTEQPNFDATRSFTAHHVTPMIHCMGTNYYPYPPVQAAPPPSWNYPAETQTLAPLATQEAAPSGQGTPAQPSTNQVDESTQIDHEARPNIPQPAAFQSAIRIKEFKMKNGNYTPVYDTEDLERYCQEHGIEGPKERTRRMSAESDGDTRSQVSQKSEIGEVTYARVEPIVSVPDKADMTLTQPTEALGDIKHGQEVSRGGSTVLTDPIPVPSIMDHLDRAARAQSSDGDLSTNVQKRRRGTPREVMSPVAEPDSFNGMASPRGSLASLPHHKDNTHTLYSTERRQVNSDGFERARQRRTHPRRDQGDQQIRPFLPRRPVPAPSDGTASHSGGIGPDGWPVGE